MEDKYSARASQSATQQSAKRASRVSGSARKQASPAQRPFAVFDIDGTLIRWQLYHAIADALAKKGHIDAKTHQKIKDARMIWKKRSHSEAFSTYQSELITVYEKLLLDLCYKDFRQAVDAVFDEYKDQVYIYSRDLIKKLKKDGYFLFAISGSQIEIVSKIAKYYGFNDCVGTIYEHEKDKFTGAMTLHLGGKHLVLQELIEKHRTSLAGSIAVGDSASDISMLEMAETPIAFNPEKKLFDCAKDKGWKIVVERKNMIYELEDSNGKYILAKTN
ncbi:HAD family phosphatase [Candidatus Saccharibacteria bacterium]|nr:HAD family phosphatase [Candidatus Saccharibacteria bacterium]